MAHIHYEHIGRRTGFGLSIDLFDGGVDLFAKAALDRLFRLG